MLKLQPRYLVCISIACMAAFLMPSCKSGNKGDKAQSAQPQVVIKDSTKASTKISLNQLMVNIPDPIKMTKELAKAGCTFNSSMLNPASNAGNYSTTYKKAVGMGVYGADLGYLSVYNQSQDIINYFNAVMTLGNGLGVNNVFSKDVIAKFKSSIGKKDTLNDLMNTVFQKADQTLYDNQRANVSTLIFAGGWVEGLYIATNAISSAKSKSDNSALYKKVWAHLFSFKYLQKALTAYKASNPDCAKMLDQLKPIDKMADNINGSDLTLADIQKMKAVITPIRKALVN